MKPNYKNWVPKSLIYEMLAGMVGTVVVPIIVFMLGAKMGLQAKVIIGVIFALGFTTFAVIFTLCVTWYRMFSHDGKRQLARKFTEGIAEYVTLPEGGTGLDVGCGSGALTIACAKKNPQGHMHGIDLWKNEYAFYDQKLCEDNSGCEGVANTSFSPDNAVRLSFADETFDAVTSNLVYHNIRGFDKQELLLETLRTLKKGGCFAIHDIMSARRYGDMESFREKLLDMGYEKVELIDTTKGLFMSPVEAWYLMFNGCTLLTGIK